MPFNLDFTDKVVLVTGSNSGIGEAIVILFSELGAKVVVHGRDKKRVSNVAQKCLDVSPNRLKPLEVVADVKIESDVDKMMDQIISHYNQLDIVVNNAGLGGGESNASMKEWDDFMNTNLRSVYQICLRSAPLLEKSKGVIINISSVCSLKPFNHSISYCVSKAGLDMLTRGLAKLWGPRGIRVNAVNPGQIDTPIWAVATKMSEEECKVLWKAVEEKTPIRRRGYPEDIAKSVAFLSSSDSVFTTGSTLKVDGGFLDWGELITN